MKLLAATILFALAFTHAPSGQTSTEQPIVPPAGGAFYGLTPQFAVSPDGRQIAFVANRAGQPAMLFVRAASSQTSRALARTEQASYPFWSADGKHVAYFAGGKLWKVPAAGGTPSVVCDAPNGRGGAWNGDGLIVLSSGITDPLRKVSASGGAVTIATKLDTPRENSHRWPQFLPDGKHVMFWAGGGSAAPAIKVAALDSTDVVTLVLADTNAVYAAGRVFFGRRNVLMAQAIDLTTLRMTGDAAVITEPLSGDVGSSFASLAASSGGTVAFTRGTARPLVLTWFDRRGKRLGQIGEPGQYTNVALSPDDKQIAVSLTAGTPPNRDVWLIDAATGAASRVTTDSAVDASPVWSPDGEKLAFSSTRGGPYQIFLRDVSAGADTLLFKADVASIVTDWSSDGRWLAFTRGTAAIGLDVWTVSATPDSPPAARVASPAGEDNATFSPDGQRLAFQANSSGRDEIYVVPLDSRQGTAPTQISTQGGTQPLWSADGKELFFLAPDGAVMSRAPDGSRQPTRLFAAPASLVIRRSYAVTSDGRRILMPILDDSVKQTITVLHNH